MDLIKSYKEDGYILLDSLYDISYCNELKKYINELDIKLKVPFYNKGFGFGNRINDDNFLDIINNSIFCETLKTLLDGDNYIINHIIINNKVRLVGHGVEWHQEFFNVNSFAPGFNVEDDEDNLIQIYIPLSDENLDNGGLKIIPKSHKLGLLKHTDIIDSHFQHKRAVDFDTLNEICKTHNIVDLNLKAGSVIFFNDLLIHSSGMNKSLIDRPSIVMGVRKNIKPLNNDILDLEIKKRKQFIIDFLKQKISDLEKGISNVGVKGENLSETWNEIYERIPWIVEQDYKNKSEFTIEDLLKIDGHSISKTGKFNIEKWYNFIDEIKFNIDYDENKISSILEIGCGCGALLKSFEKNQVYGIDLSKKMVDIAKLALPNGNFFDDHANKINLNSNTMDYILSHSCFQYFNNNQYFEETISEISRLLKSNGKIAITDVFNECNKKLNIDYRIKQIGKEKYDKLYKNLPHFYIDKNYFVSVLKKNNFDNIKIIDAGYDDEENKDVSFRYNIYAIKV